MFWLFLFSLLLLLLLFAIKFRMVKRRVQFAINKLVDRLIGWFWISNRNWHENCEKAQPTRQTNEIQKIKKIQLMQCTQSIFGILPANSLKHYMNLNIVMLLNRFFLNAHKFWFFVCVWINKWFVYNYVFSTAWYSIV